MSSDEQCPGCDRVLPDEVGRPGQIVRCRRCNELFVVGAGERLRTQPGDDLWPVHVGLLQPGPLPERSGESMDEARRASVRALGAPPDDFLLSGVDPTPGYRDVNRPTPLMLTLGGPRRMDARTLLRFERGVAGAALAGVGTGLTGIGIALPELVAVGGLFIVAALALAPAVRAMRGIGQVGPSSVFLALASGEVRMAHRTLNASDDATIRTSGRWVTVQHGEVLVLAWRCGSEASARWLSDVLRIALSPVITGATP